MRKIIIITAIILLFFGILFLGRMKNQNEKKDQMDSNASIQITEFNVEDRVTLKTDNSIYVGNNIKELENNFYDVKITNTQNGLSIYLNKLWYESYGQDYIQDEYLAKICRELSDRLNVQNDVEQFDYVLYKYIKDNYVKVRLNEDVEKIITDQFSLSFCLEDNIVKLMIQRGN